MAEFDDKLNSILSNPDAMAQIMQLAQSLSGGTGGNNAANAPPPPPSQPGGSSPGWGQQPQTPPPSGGDPLSATSLISEYRICRSTQEAEGAPLLRE